MRQKQFDHIHVTVSGSMVQRSPFPPALGFVLSSQAGKDSRERLKGDLFGSPLGTSMGLRACSQRAFNCV